MIDGLKPYPKYRESGLPSLQLLPERWLVRQARQIGRILKGVGGTKADSVEFGVPCVRYGEMYTTFNGFIRASKAFIKPEEADRYFSIRPGDVLFAASGETIEDIGRSAVNLMQAQAVCGGDIIILRPEIAVDARFLGYAFDADPAKAQKALMGRGTTVKHIYPTQLRALTILLPPLGEQVGIARFLDHATGRIERAIRVKRKLIALLNEQKQIIIQRAVTRGLDPFVRLKPSGIPWLGEIPEHWDVTRSRRLFSACKELARPDDVQLSATQSFGVIPQEEFERRVGRKVVKISMHLEKRKHVEPDDFVISMRSFQGGLERAWARGAIRSSYVVLRPGPEVDVPFFSYLFKSQRYIRALQATANFIRDGQDLTEQNFRRVDLPLIPLPEQRAIAEFIEREAEATVRQATLLEREIALLREYRTRLVADVVTGKLDVREAARNLPDEEEPLPEADEAEEDLLDEADLEADGGEDDR